MPDLLQTLIPFLLVDVMNPVLLALLIFAAATDRPVANSTAMLLGHTITYFVAGYALSYVVEQLADWIENPGSIDYVISGALGLLCLYWGLKPGKPSGDPDLPDWQLTPFKCFLFGAVVNALGLAFAIPYLGAIDQILKADISLAQAWIALGAYNIGYALPFALVPVSVLIMGERSKSFLQKLDSGMAWLTDQAMPWLIAALGVWLIYDAAAYFLEF